GFRQPDMPDLAVAPRALQEAELLLVGHRGVDAMQLIEIDALEPEPPQAAVESVLQAGSPAVDLPAIGSGPVELALGGNHQSRWIRMERIGDQLLADAGTVRLGRIDKVDTEFH